MYSIFLHYIQRCLMIGCLINYEVVGFAFKGSAGDYIVINKQVCASLSSKQKLLLKEAIEFLLHNCFFSVGDIMMIHVIFIFLLQKDFDVCLEPFFAFFLFFFRRILISFTCFFLKLFFVFLTIVIWEKKI